MIVFFDLSKPPNPFSNYLSPSLRPLAPLNLFERLHHYDIHPQVIGFEEELPEQLFSPDSKPTFINASLIPSGEQVRKLISQSPIKDEDRGGGQEWVLHSGKEIIAFSLNPREFKDGFPVTMEGMIDHLRDRIEKKVIRLIEGEYRIFKHLHQWVSENIMLLETDIEDRIKRGGLTKSRHYSNLWQGEGVVMHPSVIITGKYPVVIHDRVRVGGFTCLEGPLIIGQDSLISPHSYIKQSRIGHTVKVGGEVSSSIINDFSNKAHYGYLGNSYVGEWVNIGAGTITSNLKNNYRSVRYFDGEKQIDSGETFLGSLVGDFTKIGVNTSLAPGTVVGMGASITGTINGYVPDFSIRNSDSLVGSIKLASFIETQEKMFHRRNFHPQSQYWEWLKKLYHKSTTKNSSSA